MPEPEKESQVIESEKISQNSIVTNCCHNFHAESATTCVLCKVPICGNCFEMFEHNTICKTCHAKVLLELANENATEKDIPMAILGGFVGAIIGAALWAIVAIISGYQVGFVAIGVGFFAGQGVSIAVSRRKAKLLQFISAIFAIVGILLGTVSTNVYEYAQYFSKKGVQISYFNGDLWFEALKGISSGFSFFSVLFIAFAIYYSWRISAPRENPMHS